MPTWVINYIAHAQYSTTQVVWSGGRPGLAGDWAPAHARQRADVEREGASRAARELKQMQPSCDLPRHLTCGYTVAVDNLLKLMAKNKLYCVGQLRKIVCF